MPWGLLNMRSLPTVENAQIVNTSLEFTFTTAAGSDYMFTNKDITEMSVTRSRVKYGGGLGRTSNYKIEVAMPLADQKLILDDIPKSATRLKVLANSETFHPHFGKIATYDRPEDNVNLIRFVVTDRVFYDNPKFPVASIVDSWSNAHPTEIDADAGEPFYYGDESKRDIYFTAVTSDLSQYLGPRNVTSESHVQSSFFKSELQEIDQGSKDNLDWTGYAWNQQSGSDNFAMDVFSQWTRRFTPKEFLGPYNLNTPPVIRIANNRFFMTVTSADHFHTTLGGNKWDRVTIQNSPAFIRVGDIIWTGSLYVMSQLLVTETNSQFTYVMTSPDAGDWGQAHVVNSSSLSGLLAYIPQTNRVLLTDRFGFVFHTQNVFSGQWTPVYMEVNTITGASAIAHNEATTITWAGGIIGAVSGSHGLTRSTDGGLNWTVNTWGDVNNPPATAFSGSLLSLAPGLGVNSSITVGTDNHGAISVNSGDNVFWYMVHSFGAPYDTYVKYAKDKWVVWVGNADPIYLVSCDAITWDESLIVTDLNETGSHFLQKLSAHLVGNNEGTWFGELRAVSNGAFPDKRSIIQTGQFFIDGYERTSVFIPKTSDTSSRIAFNTENPVTILDDIFSQYLQVPYVTLQSSNVQTSVDNFKFNCYFSDREPVADIVNEFAETAGFYAWIGDSGMINYRAHAESAAATVDTAIPARDMIKFSVEDNPIGSLVGNNLINKYTFAYNYHFQRQEFQSSLNVNAANNSLCDSLQNAGIRQDEKFESKYVMIPDVASLWMENRVRVHGRSSLLLGVTLPAKYYTLELGDVVKIEQEMLVGSETLAQIVDLKVDYRRNRVKIQAEELKAFEA